MLRKEGRKECEEGGGESGGWLVRKKEDWTGLWTVDNARMDSPSLAFLCSA